MDSPGRFGVSPLWWWGAPGTGQFGSHRFRSFLSSETLTVVGENWILLSRNRHLYLYLCMEIQMLKKTQKEEEEGGGRRNKKTNKRHNVLEKKPSDVSEDWGFT